MKRRYDLSAMLANPAIAALDVPFSPLGKFPIKYQPSPNGHYVMLPIEGRKGGLRTSPNAKEVLYVCH